MTLTLPLTYVALPVLRCVYEVAMEMTLYLLLT